MKTRIAKSLKEEYTSWLSIHDLLMYLEHTYIGKQQSNLSKNLSTNLSLMNAWQMNRTSVIWILATLASRWKSYVFSR